MLLRIRQLSQATAFALGAMVLGGQAVAQQVFNSDVVVRGSLCTGFDCPNTPTFGFDTIILRENNLRIFFDDTSTTPGFPANKWRIIANDSTNGGSNFFAVEDATAARQVFRVDAGARLNSIYVAATGLIGFGTAAPGLSLHARKGDTPGLRFEQDASVGFSPQTWDMAGNEANFFIRDVTGGSRLPFRIRPGAPTSSIDISATGNIGIGTASPQKLVHINGSNTSTIRLQDTSAASNIGEFTVTGDFVGLGANRDNTTGAVFNINKATASIFLRATANDSFVVLGTTPTNNTSPIERVRVDKDGNVGIGTATPAARLHTIGTVRFAGVTGCSAGLQTNVNGDVSCLSSSQQFKNIAGDLSPSVALTNVMALRPQTGAYKTTPDEPEHWLIAEDVASVDPALAGFRDGQPYTVKTQNVVADLVAVIQQQQRRIEALERAIAK